MNKKEEFNKYIDELEEMYEKNPNGTIKELENSLNKLKYGIRTSYTTKNDNTVNGVLGDINIDILLVIVLAIIGVISGLFSNNGDAVGMWLGGYIFFIAGHYIGMYVDIFGLIFLFSHSMTGLVLMNSAIIEPILKNPIMQDNPKNIYIYISIVIGLYIIATAIVILHNLSHNLRKKKHIMLIPLAIYTLGFILINILPHIMYQLYNFNFFG